MRKSGYAINAKTINSRIEKMQSIKRVMLFMTTIPAKTIVRRRKQTEMKQIWIINP